MSRNLEGLTVRVQRPMPKLMTCQICARTIERQKMARRQRTCLDKCEPCEGLTITCPKCGEEKGYEDYHDYRDSAYGRMQWTCKACKSKKASEWYEKNKEAK